MKLCIVSFTKNGKQLSENIAKKINNIEIPSGHTCMSKNPGMHIELFTKYHSLAGIKPDQEYPVSFVETSIGEWAKEQMEEKNAMLFIGACGIAVRAVAPYLTDKLKDAPVLVMDERGRYVIPVLSGHMGGANELAACIAKMSGAEPVITTATDINETFAVDLFAKENGLFIVNKDGIAKVSSKALDGQEIVMSVTPELWKFFQKGEVLSCGGRNRKLENAAIQGKNLPAGVRIIPYSLERPADVLITSKADVSGAALVLRPKEYVIGMGCKKGKTAEKIEDFILRTLDELGISKTQVLALASIAWKKDEPGLLAWSRKENIPFLTYTAQELQDTEGNFSSSSFVEGQVGVDNVCERAAMKACGSDGRLIFEKCATDGMTIAIAKREWKAGTYET